MELELINFDNRTQEQEDRELNYIETQLKLAEEEPEEFLKKKVYCVKSLKAEKDMIKAYMDEMKTRMTRLDKNIEFHENICKIVLEKRNGDKLQGQAGTISFRKSKSVNIIDENKISDLYIAKKIVSTVDKKAIKSSIEDGNSVDGAEIVENNNLQIKG